MKLSARLGVLLATLGVLLGSACGGDKSPTTPPADTSLTAEEQSTATSIAGAFSALSQIGNVVIGAVRDALPAALPAAPPGVAFAPSVCPSITITSVQPHAIGLSIDFGAGCTTDSEFGASGKLLVTWHEGSTVDTIAVTFQSFSAEGYQFNGTLSAVGHGRTRSCSDAGTVTKNGKTWTIDATIGLVFDSNGTPTNPDDDTTSITGGGTIAADGKTYQVLVTRTLVFNVQCKYPATGILTFQEQSVGGVSHPVYEVDFGFGDCCTVKVTEGSRFAELSLCPAG
jgi:hypothetical protein